MTALEAYLLLIFYVGVTLVLAKLAQEQAYGTSRLRRRHEMTYVP